MTSLAALAADPLAASQVDAHPERLAAMLAPTVAADDFAPSASGWTHFGLPATDGEVLAACRDTLAEVLLDLGDSPARTIERAIDRDERTLARWADHPDGAERVDHYSDRLVRLREQLATQKALGDPLEPLRFSLIVAGYRLEDATGYGAYFLAELRDRVTDLA